MMYSSKSLMTHIPCDPGLGIRIGLRAKLAVGIDVPREEVDCLMAQVHIT